MGVWSVSGGLSQHAVVKLIQAGEIAATRGRGNCWEIDIAFLWAYKQKHKLDEIRAVVDGDIEILDIGEGLHAQLGVVDGPDAAS